MKDRAFVILALLLGASGQEIPVAAPGTSAAAQPQNVLRSTTHLVQLNVIVLDREGRPVPDLTRSDFTVTDDGNPETISTFSVEKNEARASPRPLRPPDTFSNRWGDEPGSVTIILLDTVNTAFTDQAYAREQVSKFLVAMRPQDRVALFALGKGIEVLHDFSGDPTALRIALANYKGRLPAELSTDEPAGGRLGLIGGEPAPRGPRSGPGVARSDAGSGVAGRMQEANQAEADYETLRRVDKTVVALEDVANYLARLPGRKNLVWVSGGFPLSLGYDTLSVNLNRPLDRGTFAQEIERGARALNNANLAIYPVDARGLIGDPRFGAERAVVRQPDGSVGEAEIRTMVELAERTGGRAFYNTNGLGNAIRQVLDDGRVTYSLSYYPTHGKWDGKFHNVKVRVDRGGVTVRHRRGYFALPEEAPTEEQRKATLNAAIWSPLNATQLGLSVRATPAADRGGQAINLRIRIDPQDLIFERSSDRWASDVQLLIVQLSAGRNLKGSEDTYHMKLKPETYRRILEEGLVIERRLPIQPGAEQVRIVVGNTEALGSVSVPVRDVLPKAHG